jgi:Ni/Fe-hydrogenase 1 B-type cytochrome subunit
MAVPVNEKTTSSQITSQKVNHLEKVYVWELPVRIFHWVAAISILVLIITGLYIADPFLSPTVHTEATANVMGWVRKIHIFTGILFTLNFIFRVYWFIVGNKYSRSNPLRKEFWLDTFETVKFYLLMKNKKKHYIGHNPLAELSYWIFFVLGSIIAISTGFFLLFEPQPHTWLSSIFAWVPSVFGGNSFSLRSLHNLVTWSFAIFSVVHIYMAFRDDWLTKNGAISSMFTGYKVEEKHEEDEKK